MRLLKCETICRIYSICVLFGCILGGSSNQTELSKRRFPDDFIFGIGSSAYQIEGAWNEDGKGMSIWDHMTHEHKHLFTNGDNGDVASDFYHKYREDVGLLEDLGVQYFRVSISWARVLPIGTIDYINWRGIEFYRSLFQELLLKGIRPMVTIYHFDIPQALEDQGGVLNVAFVDWFSDFARLMFQQFGDLVKFWMTINEPNTVCLYRYSLSLRHPQLEIDAVRCYVCSYHMLKAHAKVYHMYDKEFRPSQNGVISTGLLTGWYEPATNTTEDIEAAKVAIQFELGLYAHPIFIGDYPEVVKDRVRKRSTLEGRNSSRLIEFTPEEINYIRGTYDHFALQFYSISLVRATPEASPDNNPTRDKDMGLKMTFDGPWPSTCFKSFKATPSGLRSLLNFVKTEYNNPLIYVTESGVCDEHRLDDDFKVHYMKEYLNSALKARTEDDVDVRGFVWWSFMDSFEWQRGYSITFGVYHVDFNSTDLRRTPKKSAEAYKKIIRTRCLRELCEA